MEELNADSIEKETHITHLEVKVQEFTSSMEKAQKEAVTAFIRLNEFKTRLDRHYATGYEDFRFDAKEAYLEVDFDSFMIPTTTDSSLLPASSRTSTWWTMLQLNLSRMPPMLARTTQSLGVMPPMVYLNKFIFPLEKFYCFSLLEVPVVLGFTILKKKNSFEYNSLFQVYGRIKIQ